MDIRKLQRAIVDGLEDVKAQNIVVFNTEHLSPLFERVIIASGTSNRQTKALASSVRVTVKERGMDVLRCEGEENGEWIIVDCGAAVVHVMQPAIRDYYHLEEIWGGKPVKMALGDGKTKLVKASDDDEEDAAPAKKPAKKAVKPSLPGKPGVSKKVAAKEAEAKPAAKKTAAKKVVAKKSASSREVDHKTPATQTLKVGLVKPAAKKVAAKKVATKTVGVKKAPAKSAAKPAAKTTATKAPAKKVVAKKAAR
ncbi:ribosome silencing factor [Paucibacter sp. Y2R2-4]|uniref:ribosome silencing factor n=1 Tax=Paucibacter sp. Y2R2-4 TaxID=2893553 RepID=UPI0021E37E9F|nr:ribosome silencing factor [Paucibacter sp. Y2R2-4]MCV2351917.1 ribosome silencing factor [Paucibacter sp. Y2R2-4]